jgi:hypothetical protein
LQELMISGPKLFIDNSSHVFQCAENHFIFCYNRWKSISFLLSLLRENSK